MIDMPMLFFYLHCIVALVAAVVGLVTTRGARTSMVSFLLSMSSLVGILILLGAHVIAIAQLFFCVGLGFIFFFVVGVVDVEVVDVTVVDQPEERVARGSSVRSWQWLVIICGIGFATVIGSLLFEILPNGGGASTQAVSEVALGSSESVGLAVLIDQGVALVGVGLLLLASLIGAGFLTRRGVD
jgi:NADH:ubiquinone oxidoreductase subunit 6 (subunit J)